MQIQPCKRAFQFILSLLEYICVVSIDIEVRRCHLTCSRTADLCLHYVYVNYLFDAVIIRTDNMSQVDINSSSGASGWQAVEFSQSVTENGLVLCSKKLSPDN